MPTSKPSRPNFVMIHTDQQRADCLGIHGHPELLTPNLDRLATSGADFRQAYSPAPVCSPARRSMMTGCTPATDGCLSNAPVRIRHPEHTLPALLKRAGYQTANIGRGMHQYPGNARYGFEVVESSPFDLHDSRVHDEIHVASRNGGFGNWPHLLNHGLTMDGYTARPWPYSEDFHQTTWTVNKAIEYLDRRDEEAPFFLAVGIVAPHPPLTPPACYYDRYHAMNLRPPAVGDWAKVPENNAVGLGPLSRTIPLGGEQIRSAMAAYYGLINHLDDMIHNLLWRLNTCGPTYVLFCSDHGEQLGDHHMFRKAQPYQGSVHVPFMLRGPGIPENTKVDAPVSLEDILPTFCDLADVAIPEHVEGRSLVPLWSGSNTADWRPFVHGEQGEDPAEAFHYLTDGKFKYIWFSRSGREQLFDLAEDPRETTELAADKSHQKILEHWRERLREHLRDRQEGFVQNGQLMAGCRHPAVLPHALPV